MVLTAKTKLPSRAASRCTIDCHWVSRSSVAFMLGSSRPAVSSAIRNLFSNSILGYERASAAREPLGQARVSARSREIENPVLYFIATLGLPQVSMVNEAMRQCLENAFNCGYEYTYLYPGIQKVAQAAGRIIRASTDEGTLTLIDDRYGYTEVQELLPRWWRWPRMEQFDYAE